MYQVGKETKYLQMMHGQPSIKTAIEIWVLYSHSNILRNLSNLKIFTEECTSRNYLFWSLSSLSSLFTSAFILYIKFSNI